MKTLKHISLVGTLAFGMTAMSTQAMAQSYPDKPIRLIVADAPGGAPDILARMLAQKMSDSMGQPVVVDNKPGAAGMLGAEQAARAPADGYNLFMNQTAVWGILPSVKKNLPYDPVNSFMPITRIAITSNVMVINPSISAKTVPELVKLAKANPGSINYASAGIASPAHLAGEMFNLLADVKLTHVPYKGAGPALLDVIGGQVQLIITSPIAAGAHIGTGKVRALATTGAQRNPALPDLPTIAESVKGYEISQAWGITVPTGTPAAIVNRLHAEIIKAISQPDTRDRISKLGAVPFTETPGEFAAAIAADRKRLGDVITKTGIVLAD